MSLPQYIYITPFFPSPNTWRGAYCYDFVVALKKLGVFDVHVFVPDVDDYEYEGIRVHGFKMVGLPSATLPNLFNGVNGKRFLKAVTQAGIDLNDVAVCHANTAALAFLPFVVKEKNSKCLTIMHHHDLGSIGLRIGRLHRFLWQRAANLLPRREYFENIDLHVFVSSAVEKSFRLFPDCSWTSYEDYRICGKGLQGFKPLRLKHTMVLHNGVDKTIFHREGELAAFQRPEAREVSSSSSSSSSSSVEFETRGQRSETREFSSSSSSSSSVEFEARDQRQETGGREAGGAVPMNAPSTAGINDNSVFRIGCIANLEDSKDPITLVKACIDVARTHSVQLSVIGSGPDVLEMKRLAAAGNLDLEILPEVPHFQLPDFYHSLDLFVLPSYFEGFGCVFTEANSCGVPFITCEGQGMDDLIPVQDRHLWLCDQRNVDDLALKIKYYIEHRPTQILTEDQDINKLVAQFYQKVLEFKA